MADFATKLKCLFVKSAKVVSRTAKTAAKATKFKVDELSNLGKRRDLINELGEKVVELCHAGLSLPEDAVSIIRQIEALEGELTILRADRAAQKAAAAEQRAVEKAARAAEKAAERSAAAIRQGTAVVEMDISAPEVPPAEINTASAGESDVPVLKVQTEPVASKEDTDIPTLNI